MSDTRFCYVNLVLDLRASESSGSRNNKNPDAIRKHSWTICVGRAEKRFLQLIWISFPFFRSPDPPKGTSRRVWLVVEKKGNTRGAHKLTSVRDARISLLSYQSRNSKSSQLTPSPIHHQKKFRTLNFRHRTPVCLNSSSFPGNYPHSIPGSPAQLSFTSSPTALATSSWLAMAGSHDTDWKYQTNIFEPFLRGDWWSNPDQWAQGRVSWRLMGKVFCLITTGLRRDTPLRGTVI